MLAPCFQKQIKFLCESVHSSHALVWTCVTQLYIPVVSRREKVITTLVATTVTSAQPVLGCILAELHTGYPLFPGENEAEQLACIMELLGPPPPDLLLHATRKRLFFDSKGSPRTVTNSKGRKRRPGSRALAAAARTDDPAFLHFLHRCLESVSVTSSSPAERNVARVVLMIGHGMSERCELSEFVVYVLSLACNG
ncbi:Dual specificity tyrosine-phosphorylation-regulated kinase 2 [Eumeta japonica]|uniref:Dual specificity tyrosine-phosphorylation-regulated kinase 2 n=1 Tax=Eumeta variegata TaxID=151549 RepID=A0A4C1W8L9_EUMVA|nr:Dual specificity tyrosine-phosphorylation-regulated kinase 2 [Eumeta japonica]